MTASSFGNRCDHPFPMDSLDSQTKVALPTGVTNYILHHIQQQSNSAHCTWGPTCYQYDKCYCSIQKLCLCGPLKLEPSSSVAPGTPAFLFPCFWNARKLSYSLATALTWSGAPLNLWVGLYKCSITMTMKGSNTTHREFRSENLDQK